jgi:hypothetical protein
MYFLDITINKKNGRYCLLKHTQNTTRNTMGFLTDFCSLTSLFNEVSVALASCRFLYCSQYFVIATCVLIEVYYPPFGGKIKSNFLRQPMILHILAVLSHFALSFSFPIVICVKTVVMS